jgi:hypothetical protein
VKDLNISRIILFAVVLLVVHVLIGALIPGAEEYEEPSARVFWLVTGYLVQAAAVIAIFVRLAQVQARLLYVHVACVLVLSELLGLAVMFALVGHLLTSSLMVTVLDYSVLFVSTVIGTEIGRRLRVAAEKKTKLASK